MHVNKTQLAHWLTCSLPTLSRWMLKYGADFPVVERGSNGRDYVFDAAAVADFLRARQAELAAAGAERDEQLAQLKLPFDVPGAELPLATRPGTIKDEIDAFKLRRLQREEAERAGQLVPAEPALDAFRGVLTRLSRDMHSFIRNLGREQSWPDSYTRSLEARLTDLQSTAVRQLDADLAISEAAFGTTSEPERAHA